jgi:hypothetical protein
MRKISFLSTSLLGLLLTAGTVAAEPSPRTFTAHLSGDQERPQAVDIDAQGEAIFHLTRDGDALNYKLIVSGLDGITSADVHVIQNTDGTGPLVASLYAASADEDLPGAVLTDGALQSTDLKGPLAGKTLADLVTEMENGKAYVNIDTRLNSAGAIRGDFEMRGQDDEQDSPTIGNTATTSASPTATVTPTATPTEEATNPGKTHANGHADQADHGQP